MSDSLLRIVCFYASNIHNVLIMYCLHKYWYAYIPDIQFVANLEINFRENPVILRHNETLGHYKKNQKSYLYDTKPCRFSQKGKCQTVSCPSFSYKPVNQAVISYYFFAWKMEISKLGYALAHQKTWSSRLFQPHKPPSRAMLHYHHHKQIAQAMGRDAWWWSTGNGTDRQDFISLWGGKTIR